MRVEALLLLGSNLGDRPAALRRAVASLRRTEGVSVLAASRVVETAPVGPSNRPYLNQALRIATTRTPMGLLIEAKRLEAAAGRRPGIRWGARPLDIDLIAYGRARVRTPWLTVPHPLAARRDFVLEPLAGVAPRWRLDGRRTVAALLAARRKRSITARPTPRSGTVSTNRTRTRASSASRRAANKTRA